MKAKKTHLAIKVCRYLSAILLLALCAAPAEAADKQSPKGAQAPRQSRAVAESEGLTYSYETVQLAKAMLGRHDISGDLGMITIFDGPDSKNIVHQEKYVLPPGCSKFPTISKFTSRSDTGSASFVVTCGSDEGHHQTMKIFKRGESAFEIRIASLDFENSFPNLTYDKGHGFYTARVYKRILTEDFYGTVDYPFVYRLLDDGSTFAFVPVFGSPAEQSYLSYYRELKETVKRREAASKKPKGPAVLFEHFLGPMLAALVASQNEGKVCAEVATLKPYGVTPKDLQAWRKSLVTLGYPDFDFDKCKETTK